MGNARWDIEDWSRVQSRTRRATHAREAFTQRMIHEEFDPRNIKMRESRDSEANPESNAIILGFDETASMGHIPFEFVREGLGTMVREILDRKPVSDPHILIMGVGDARSDQAPLQVSQFEADIRIADQLQNIYLEGLGGGNDSESYTLPWYFAAKRTSIDCWEKRGKKGYLFTVGDELPPPNLPGRHIEQVMGEKAAPDVATSDALDMACRTYEVYHVVAEEGGVARHNLEVVYRQWRELLGERVIRLSDHRRLAECVVSTIEINEGRDPREVMRSWHESDAQRAVEHAMESMA